VYPPLCLFESTFERSKSHSLLISDVQLPPEYNKSTVVSAIRSVVRCEPMFFSPLVKMHDIDPQDPESWWTAYDLGDATFDDSLVNEVSDFDHQPTIPPFQSVLVEICDAPSCRARLIAKSSVVDDFAARIFWNRVAAALAGQELAQTQTPVLYHQLFERWQAGIWNSSHDYWKRIFESFPALENAGEDLSIWPHLQSTRIKIDRCLFDQFQSDRNFGRFLFLANLIARATSDAWGWETFPFLIPFNNRNHPDSRIAIGHFANVLPLSVSAISPRHSEEVLTKLSTQLFQLARHGHYPVELCAAESLKTMALLQAGRGVILRVLDLSAGAFERSIPPDSPGLSFGHAFALCFDLIVSSNNQELRVTYRSDRVGKGAIEKLRNVIEINK
jgi:hypothetical protein